MQDIKKRVEAKEAELRAIRRALHQIPEKGFGEHKTAHYVADRLRSIAEIDVTTGVAETGVVGLLTGRRPGKTLLVRADMDALPIKEQTGLDFASTHDSMMHACGHDGHMAMALVAADILAGMRDSFSGAVKFMFQPAEEGPGGAKPMIEAGVLENPHVDYAVACHVWPGLPSGYLGVKAGVLMAAASSFVITVTGKGGHGAMPQLCVDALDTAVQIAGALQRLVNQKIDPLHPSVLTVGSLHSGSAPNIIPETAELTGMFRTFDRKTWQAYPAIIEQVAQGICDSTGASCQCTFSHGYPPLENDPDMVQVMKKSMEDVVPAHQIVEPESTMGAEDMAFILEQTKGCYFIVGTGFKGCAPLHNASFTFDEKSLLPGVETLVRFALNLLG